MGVLQFADSGSVAGAHGTQNRGLVEGLTLCLVGAQKDVIRKGDDLAESDRR